jgi:trehalose/maltose transport system substrate-binding protein
VLGWLVADGLLLFKGTPGGGRLGSFPRVRKRSEKTAMELSQCPTLIALYSDQDVLAKNAWFKNLLDVYQNAVARPSTVSGADYNQISIAFFQNVNKVLSGEESPQDAVKQVEQVAKRVVR